MLCDELTQSRLIYFIDYLINIVKNYTIFFSDSVMETYEIIFRLAKLSFHLIGDMLNVMVE